MLMCKYCIHGEVCGKRSEDGYKCQEYKNYRRYVHLPCSPSNTLYMIYHKGLRNEMYGIRECEVIRIVMASTVPDIIIGYDDERGKWEEHFSVNRFGHDIFDDEDEAQKELKRRTKEWETQNL